MINSEEVTYGLVNNHDIDKIILFIKFNDYKYNQNHISD